MERFKNAATDGVTVEATSLSLENLLSHLEKKGPAIILINAAIARCDTCVTFMEVISGFLKKIINLKESYYGIIASSYWFARLTDSLFLS